MDVTLGDPIRVNLEDVLRAMRRETEMLPVHLVEGRVELATGDDAERDTDEIPAYNGDWDVPGCNRRECWLCHYRDAGAFHAGQYVEYWLKPDYIVGGGWLRGVVAELIAPRHAIVTSEATGERHRLAFDRLRCPQCGGTGEAVASERLYGTPEAAAALDLSVEAVRKIAGQLGLGTKLRSGWVFTGAEVEAMRARPDGRAGRKMPSRRSRNSS